MMHKDPLFLSAISEASGIYTYAIPEIMVAFISQNVRLHRRSVLVPGLITKYLKIVSKACNPVV